MSRTKSLKRTTSSGEKNFWGEIAPCDHSVQIYRDKEAFLDSLEGFVVAGLRKGEAVIIIATKAHRTALETRLRAYGLDVNAAKKSDQFISLDADETLSQFMVNGWPDAEKFSRVVADLLERARSKGRRVRAFGEMVALLWARGMNGATVRLEHLWHDLCRAEQFPLFCAYPRSGFTTDAAVSMKEICAAHSRLIGEVEEVRSLQDH